MGDSPRDRPRWHSDAYLVALQARPPPRDGGAEMCGQAPRAGQAALVTTKTRKARASVRNSVAPGWPVPPVTPLAADLDRAAARRAAERLAEPFVPPPATSESSKEQASMSYTSAQRVKVKVVNPISGPGKGAKFARIKLPNDIVVRLGPKIEDIAFDVELDDEGIFLRPSNGRASTSVEVPSWAK